MGLYTEHWAEFTRDTNRRTLQLLGVLLLLPLIALLGYGLSQITAWSTHIVVVLLIAWLALLTLLSLRATRVPCPRCATQYSRGKGLVNCPQCGLRMFQDDPG